MDIFHFCSYFIHCVKLRGIFGGARHATTCMFEAASKKHNGGKYIGFINPSECRMGGAQICLLRLLRLKDVLREVVNSRQFLDLKLHKAEAYIIKLDSFWDLVFAFCRCNYAPMRLLRLSDIKSAVMDKVKYYVIQTGNMIDQYAEDLSQKWYSFCTPYVKNLLIDNSTTLTHAPLADENMKSEHDFPPSEDEEEEEDSFDSDVYDQTMLDSDDEERPDEDTPVTLCDSIKAAWEKRKEKLIHDYSRAGYILSPDPVIMAHALANPDPEDKAACARLIGKLFIPSHLVGETRDNLEASLIDSFHEEYDAFTTKSGETYCKKHIWITAARTNNVANEWHQRYSAGTKILGRLACHVTSKIGGIGNAERSWKAVKNTKKGRYLLQNEKTKMQATISGNYNAQRNEKQRLVSQTAGTLWEEKDFHTLKLTKFCMPLTHATNLSSNDTEKATHKRVFRAWCEKWECPKLKKSGNTVLEARLVNKYGGLKWVDPDNETMPVVTAHPDKMRFTMERGNNRYDVLAMGPGFDLSKNETDQPDDVWDFWEKGYDLYGQITEYYEANPDPNVIIYQEGECLSEDEDDKAGAEKNNTA